MKKLLVISGLSFVLFVSTWCNISDEADKVWEKIYEWWEKLLNEWENLSESESEAEQADDVDQHIAPDEQEIQVEDDSDDDLWEMEDVLNQLLE